MHIIHNIKYIKLNIKITGTHFKTIEFNYL